MSKKYFKWTEPAGPISCSFRDYLNDSSLGQTSVSLSSVHLLIKFQWQSADRQRCGDRYLGNNTISVKAHSVGPDSSVIAALCLNVLLSRLYVRAASGLSHFTSLSFYPQLLYCLLVSDELVVHSVNTRILSKYFVSLSFPVFCVSLPG